MSSQAYSRRRSYRRGSESDESSDTSSKEVQATPVNSSQSAFDISGALSTSRARNTCSIPALLVSLARSGIPGPRDLKVLNLTERGIQIGKGAQFTVFKSHPRAGGLTGRGYADLEGLAVKRVNMKVFRENGVDMTEGDNYQMHLRNLELEIIALCHSEIRNHRNVARLMAWGRDYIDSQTPVPALFVELAECSMDEFLQRQSTWHVKHQLALDIASGLEVLHKHHIVHGDMKPENVLIFKTNDSKVRFVAKLSDFGLCTDLLGSVKNIDVYSYAGTNQWNAPELQKRDMFEKFTGMTFEPSLMFKFDAYSFGFVLLSIFCCGGKIPLSSFGKPTARIEAAEALIQKTELPSSLKSKLCDTVRQLLDSAPSKRPKLSHLLLKTQELSSYTDW
jgi:serine/threonine protein kinase